MTTSQRRLASLSRVTARRSRRLFCDNHGAVLVEFAVLAIPFTLLAVSGLMLGLDAFLAERLWMQIEFASEAAARCMAIGNPNCLNPEATASYAASLVKIVALPAGTFVVTPGALCGNLVTASYTYTPPFTQKASFFADFLPTSFSINTSACYPPNP
jgi:Flp pilus assembly protein TadG